MSAAVTPRGTLRVADRAAGGAALTAKDRTAESHADATRASFAFASEGAGAEALWTGFLGLCLAAWGLAHAFATWESVVATFAGATMLAAAVGLVRAHEWARLVAAVIALVAAALSIVQWAERGGVASPEWRDAAYPAFELLLALALLLPSTKHRLANRRAWLVARRSR